MDDALTVEVFPIGPDRWIAVVEAPAGPFSTEAATPAEVQAQVRLCIREVLGSDVPFMLADELGRPWTTGEAPTQLARLSAALAGDGSPHGVREVASIGSGSERLELVLRDVGRGVMTATLCGAGLQASRDVQPHCADDGYRDLADFFGHLEASWRGWEGLRSWASLEGELSITARHTGSHVVLRVQLENAPFSGTAEWTACLDLTLGAGEELSAAASTVRGLAGR